MTELTPTTVTDSYVAELQAIPLDQDGAIITLEKENPTANTIYLEALGKEISLASSTPNIPKLHPTLDKKVISLDVETTGLNPWEYQILVCSCWDLGVPKSDMITFAGWDEEELCTELFAWIEEQQPDVLLAFNAKFEVRSFITRAMLYHINAPWIWTCEWHDMLDMLGGGWKNGLTGTQPAGSEENWLKFFFNEKKPYTIDECFEAVREGRLTEFIIRNRTCVQGQGDMYQLLQYCAAPGSSYISEEKPSSARIDEWQAQGNVLVGCEVCGAINEQSRSFSNKTCWRCLSALPQATEDNIIREQTRTLDYSVVGLSAKEIAAKEKAATSKK
jgi:hypothetical protein